MRPVGVRVAVAVLAAVAACGVKAPPRPPEGKRENPTPASPPTSTPTPTSPPTSTPTP